MFRRMFMLLLAGAEAVWRTVVRTGTGLIVANDTTENQPVKLEMQGWTEQNKYDGKNLMSNIPSDWNMNQSLSWGTIAGTPIGYDVSKKNSSVIIIHGIKNNTKYSFKNLKKENLWLSRIIQADENGLGYVNIVLYNDVETQNKEEYSFTVSNENVTTLYVIVRTLPESGTGSGTSADITEDDIRNMQICLSEGYPIYEPYTGSQPSPSPEYQQDVVNSGKYNEETQKYEVEVKLIRKNVSNPQNFINDAFVRFDGGVTDTSIQTKDLKIEEDIISCYQVTNVNGVWFQTKIPVVGNTEYISSLINLEGITTTISPIRGITYYDDKDNIIGGAWDYRKDTFITPDKSSYAIIAFTVNQNTEINKVYTFKHQLEIGTTYTSYEPYKEPQTVTVTSDRPITKWDRLVEKDGQIGWEYGGKETVMYGNETLYTYSDGFYVFKENDWDTQAKDAYCDTLVNANSYGNKQGVSRFSESYGDLNFLYVLSVQNVYGNTVEEIRKNLSLNPLTFWHKVSTPEFVPLPAEEQEAIRALKTYYPTTVFSNDDELFMQVEYLTNRIRRVKCLVQHNDLAYIDTGYVVTQNTNMKIAYSYETVCFIFGSRNQKVPGQYNIYGDRPDYGKYGIHVLVPDDNGIYNVEFDRGQVINNGIVVDSNINIENSLSEYPLYIFAINNGGTAKPSIHNTKIYKLELYEGDVLSRQFLPVLDTNGKACFFETVQGKYYYGNYDYKYEP